MERVLLLSMGFGTGHNAAAQALEAEYRKLPDVEAETVDLLQLIPKTFHPLMQSGYHGMLAKFPFFYHYLYDWTYQSKVIRQVSSEIIEKMGWTIRKKMIYLLEEINPTRIVTTHPFSLLLIPPAWQKLPTIGVVTDYEIHPMWIVRVPDVLCVPKRLLDQHEIERLTWKSGVKIVETGIPIHQKYYQTISQREARRKLRLDSHRPIVLVMGGGMGLGPMELMVEEISKVHHIQFIVFTGNNHQLRERIQRRRLGSHIQIEGYRKDIDLFMSAADLLITKPGGLTITEAIAKRLPMFLFQAFPGQEEANQQYLVSHRVAVITRPSTIRLQLEKQFLGRMSSHYSKERFHPIMAPDASQKVIEATFESSSSQIYML